MESPVESEVKVRCDDVAGLIAAHPELGWQVDTPRHFEDNYVFDLPGDALKERDSILRLRIANGRAVLTYKGLLPESATSDLKIREELETDVTRSDMLVAIFERLGLRRVFQYQKYRTIYRLDHADGPLLAMHDETPFGSFLEIEGDAARVTAVAGALGFPPSVYVRDSYIGIQSALCAARGVPLQDLIFE